MKILKMFVFLTNLWHVFATGEDSLLYLCIGNPKILYYLDSWLIYTDEQFNYHSILINYKLPMLYEDESLLSAFY